SFVDLLTTRGMETSTLSLDYVASLVTIVDDINALIANNQTVSDSVLVNSGEFTNIVSENLNEYNSEFTRLGTLGSIGAIQAVIDEVNAHVTVLAQIVGYADNNDASGLSFIDLNNVIGLTALDTNNHAYYQTLIAANIGSNVDAAAKLQTLIDSANASQFQIDAIGQYAASNNADALTIDMLQGIAGLTVDNNNLSHYQAFVVESSASDIIDLASLQLIINDADAFVLDPQWAVTGQAVANNISGASVRVFAIEAGSKGTDLTKTAGTTDANGAFSMAIVPTSLPVMMEITGGSYVDEATGMTLNNSTLTAVLPEIARRDVVTVSPLTDIAAKRAASDLTVAGINAANALITSTFLDSTNANDVFAIAPVDMNATGTGLAQQYRSALIGLSVLGGGEALINITQDLATDLADNSLDVNTAKALYFNTQTWLRRHGMTDLALNVPTFGLDSAAQQAVDTVIANDTTLGYFPEILQTSTGSLDLTTLLSGYVPAGSNVSVSILEGDSLTPLTGTFDTSLYSSGAQVQISVDVDGVARLETITLQPSATPVSVTSTLSDINNGSHTLTVTASDSQSVTIESLTPDVATIANDQISVGQDGTARFAVTANDGTWQDVVSLDVLSPRTAPSIDWALNASGDLQVASINGDTVNVNVSYQGSDSSLTMMTLLPVDRNASDSISWMVEKDGVRFSTVQSVDVADVVNPIAINNLTARVTDTSISDADLFAEFMDLVDVATDATTLGLYRNELSSNSVSSITALQTLITEQNLTATAFIDLQNTDVASITLVQLQALMPEQVLHESIVDDYRTALADNTWMSPSDVQSLIVDVNDELILAFGPTGDYDRDGIINSEDPDADNDGINNEYELAAGFDPYDSADIDFSIDNNNDGKADIWFTIQAAMPTSGMDIDTWNAHVIAQNIPPEVVVNTFINQSAQETVNLSTLGGEVSYEFIVHFAVDRSNSLAIFGNSATGWSLRLEQWNDTGKLGVTRYGVGDYTFNALSGQSVNSPYGDPAHVIYIMRSGMTEVWVNGVQVGDLNNQALLINQSSVPLGIMEGTVNGDEGIYGFAAYNHALSEDEILSAYQNALDVYVDSDGDGIYDRLDPDDDNDGYLDNGDPDITGFGTGQVLAGVLGDINDLLANNQNIEESVLVDSGRFSNIMSSNMVQYNTEFSVVANFTSYGDIQDLIDEVNTSVNALNLIVGFANGNDASTLTVTQLNSVMNLSGVDANNLLYYQALIASDIGSNVDTSAKLQTLITSANSSQSQIDTISQYATSDNANALTIAMLQGIAGLSVDTNNLSYYQNFIEESEAPDVSDLVKLQILIDDANAFALDPQWAITGQAVANNISGATVRVYAIEANSKGTDLTKTAGTTDANGAFSMAIIPTDLPVIMEITGGVYIDESTGISLNNGTLTAILPVIARRDAVTVSPLTDIAAKVAGSNLTVTGINAANALITSTFLDSTNANDVFAIAPADMNATGAGLDQQYRTALIGLSVLGGGESLANVTQDLAADLSDNILDVNTAKALYFNTQTWLRRHGMTDLALNV
ncbi:beta strand repeat-containing protein, partial [Aliivibrio finisterrensis]|uniref:beta strand repeat-containing protein n=1 Tax=Aliivibrio finisterrensis TaxID=511998 RepID=UPI00142EA962